VIKFLGPFMWDLDIVALAAVVYKCFGLSFSLSVHHFIFRAALDRTRWRGLRTFLPEVRELQGRRELSCLFSAVNPFNAELNPICHLLALLEAHHILHVSRLRVKGLKKPG